MLPAHRTTTPLSSRFDENDAILVMDNVLIPWENVLIYRDFDRCRRWTMEGGFARMYPLQACVRLAVKLYFITALLKKSLECTGTLEFRGVQADLGEVVAWRNTFWALSDSMCSEATPWVNGAYLPDHAALQTYRVLAPMAYAKIKNIIERNVTSGLIYPPSSARDLNNTADPRVSGEVCARFERYGSRPAHQDPQTDAGCDRQRVSVVATNCMKSTTPVARMRFACSVCARHKAPAIWTR